jgi:hypothetical protein
LWPALRAMIESEAPKPDAQPVISQTRALEGEDIVCGASSNNLM